MAKTELEMGMESVMLKQRALMYQGIGFFFKMLGWVLAAALAVGITFAVLIIFFGTEGLGL